MVGPPLGLLLIAGYLRQSFHAGSITVYDARLSAKTFFDKRHRQMFGDNDQEICRRISEGSPHVIGISNMYSSQIDQAYRMADLARSVAPKATIVIGGPHVTVFPTEALEKAAVDYVILGEGEERFAKLINALTLNEKPDIEGVLGRSDLHSCIQVQNLSFIQDLDRLPFPAYDLVDLAEYFRLARHGFSPRFREWGDRALSIITSRGCPHVCSFCSIHSTMGYKYRYFSAEYVRAYVQYLTHHFDVDFLHFEDDNLTHIPQRYEAIIESLASFKQLRGWDTPNGVRGDAWTYDRVKRTKESGCQFLSVAVESAVPRILDQVIHKDLDLEHVDRLIEWCCSVHLRLHAFYIIGFPGETLDDMQTTIRYALYKYWKYGVTPFLQPLIPIPNTAIYDKVVKGRLFTNRIEIQYNQVVTDAFNPRQVQNLFATFLWLKMCIFIFRSLTSIRDLHYNLRLIFKYPRAMLHALITATRSNRRSS